ncbi:phosphatase 2C-like domain-containing protein [Hysterangium stoloniferum]|nr:phosphatase 2C-like domain-containing protein [Hysterangium stoloniferum]
MSNICYKGNSPIGHYDTHHTIEDMNTQFASKATIPISPFDPNFKVHQASFQAYKIPNEDRIAVLRTHYGWIVGVFDGHYDDHVSEYASKNLIKEVDIRITAEIGKNQNNLGDAIPICLVDTIQNFDATLHHTLIEKMRAMDSKPWSEWTEDDVPRFLGMQEMGEHDPYPIMRRACAGSTALIAVIISSSEHNMWVASLGDSEGYLGRIVNNRWTAIPLNDLHNLNNAAEVQRLQEEHPGEDDLIVYHRTKDQLGVTRALGDAILKVPIDLASVLSTMWGCPIPPEATDRWAQQKHTPPYISSTPSVMYFSIKKGDRLVFCSDGLRSSLMEQGVPDQDVGNMIVSIAGMDLLDVEAMLSCEKSIGHSFIPSTDINNLADIVIRNILFGLDNHRMAKETMATMNSSSKYLRDDMSVVVVDILE